jgi:hypothetical protein
VPSVTVAGTLQAEQKSVPLSAAICAPVFAALKFRDSCHLAQRALIAEDKLSSRSGEGWSERHGEIESTLTALMALIKNTVPGSPPKISI